MMTVSAASRRTAFFAAMLLLAGIALRGVYLAEFSRLPHFALAVGADVLEYDARARAILAGRFFPAEPDIHAPLYSCFLAGVYRITGYSVPAARLLQLALNFAAWVALWLLLRRRRLPAGMTWSFLALAMLLPVPCFHQAELISESLAIPLVAALLWLCELAESAPDDRRRLAFCAGAGAVGGMLVLLHGILAFFPAALAAALLLRRRFAAAGCFVGAALLVAGSFAAIQCRHYRRAMPIQANGGFNFWLGNRAGATGGCDIRPGAEWRRLHREAKTEAARRGISADRVWLGRAGEFWRRNPPAALALWGRKALLLFDGKENIAGADPGGIVCRTRVMRFGIHLTLLVNVAALAGIFLRRRKWREDLPFLLLAGSLAFVQIVTVTSGRYRLAMLPALLFFAAAAVGEGVRQRGARRLIVLLVAVLLLALSSMRTAGFAEQGLDETYSLLGEAEYRCGNFAAAEGHLRFAAERTDDPRRFGNLLGAIAEARGDFAAAEKRYRSAARSEPDGFEAWMNLGNLLGMDPARRTAAEECFRRAFALAPESSQLHFNYALFRRGDVRVFHSHLFRALELDPRNAAAWNALGVAAMQSGRARHASGCFRSAAEAAPRETGYWNNLRIAALAAGDRIAANEAERELVKRQGGRRGN